MYVYNCLLWKTEFSFLVCHSLIVTSNIKFFLDRCGQCDVNADCNFDPAANQFRCQCQYSFYGDGIRCDEYDCRETNVCAPNAVCEFDVNYNAFLCHCSSGYTGLSCQ